MAKYSIAMSMMSGSRTRMSPTTSGRANTLPAMVRKVPRPTSVMSSVEAARRSSWVLRAP